MSKQLGYATLTKALNASERYTANPRAVQLVDGSFAALGDAWIDSAGNRGAHAYGAGGVYLTLGESTGLGFVATPDKRSKRRAA